MDIQVYFGDNFVNFSDCGPRSADAVEIPQKDAVRAKILRAFDTSSEAYVRCDDPEKAFREFAKEFLWVESAGCLAENDRGEYLMILVRGRWSLPKGHVDPGEEVEQTAARETREEAGIESEIVRPLCNTLHAYNVYGQWELKCTHWFLSHADGDQTPVPQTEEDIEKAEWLSVNDIMWNLKDSYPTIRLVFDSSDIW